MAGAASTAPLLDEHHAAAEARLVSRTRKHEADMPPAGLSVEDHTAAASPREHRPLPASQCGAQHLSQHAVCCLRSPCPRKQTLTSSCYSQTTWGSRGGGHLVPNCHPPTPVLSSKRLAGTTAHLATRGWTGSLLQPEEVSVPAEHTLRPPDPGPQNEPPSSSNWPTHISRSNFPEAEPTHP